MIAGVPTLRAPGPEWRRAPALTPAHLRGGASKKSVRIVIVMVRIDR